jgi:hypothetical protein
MPITRLSGLPQSSRGSRAGVAKVGIPDGGTFDRWHITSTDIHEASFPLPNTIINRGFTHAVAFHGFSDDDILIGGGASDSLKTELKEAINDALNNEGSGCKVIIRIARAEDNFNGDSPRNIVNRLANGSWIQINRLWRSESAAGLRSPRQSLRSTGEYWPERARRAYNDKVMPENISISGQVKGYDGKPINMIRVTGVS